MARIYDGKDGDNIFLLYQLQHRDKQGFLIVLTVTNSAQISKLTDGVGGKLEAKT